MLPNFVNKNDLTRRIAVPFYREYNIPIGVVRKDPNWCAIVAWADVGGIWIEEILYRIRLKENQLPSFKELVEEFCDEFQIPFKKD